jgi:pimeloyl-ACP methyl ester carboxylesterase
VAQRVNARDGRALAVYEDGDPNGVPVVVQHGTPASGLLDRNWVTLAREQGIRLIGYDRPGYGGSTRHAGRSVGDCAADVEAIADALGLDRFATWGISGGGPHALACAALCDDRLAAVASLAAVAPYEAESLDWLAGMGDANIVEFGATLEGEPALRRFLENEAAGMRQASAKDIVAVFDSLLGPADRAVLSEEFAAEILQSSAHGLADGVDGWLDDDFAFARPWGFDVATSDRPVLLLHGADDRFVPIAHGRWLAERVRGVEARLTGDEDGHLTLIARRIGEVHEWLLAHI